MPRRPMAATVNPIIEPPKKAIFKAAPAPFSLAAIAVLTFAFVAVYMPMYPADPEQTAPSKKAKAVSHPKNVYRAAMQIIQKILITT